MGEELLPHSMARRFAFFRINPLFNLELALSEFPARIRPLRARCRDDSFDLVFADVMSSVKRKLDRYGISELVGEDSFYRTVGIAVKASSGTSSS